MQSVRTEVTRKVLYYTYKNWVREHPKRHGAIAEGMGHSDAIQAALWTQPGPRAATSIKDEQYPLPVPNMNNVYREITRSLLYCVHSSPNRTFSERHWAPEEMADHPDTIKAALWTQPGPRAATSVDVCGITPTNRTSRDRIRPRIEQDRGLLRRELRIMPSISLWRAVRTMLYGAGNPTVRMSSTRSLYLI